MLKLVNKKVKSISANIPAPIFGLNKKDTLSAMDVRYAITLDNYIPLDNKLVLRSGYSKYCQLGNKRISIKTIASYRKPNRNKLIALYDNKAFNITNPKNIKEYENVEIDTTIYCQTVQYKDHLFFMNGSQTPKVYSCTDEGVETFEDWKFTTTSSLVPARIISGAVSKERLWFVEKDTLKAWYSKEVADVKGELVSFDLSQVSKRGGELIAVANWTIDGGIGIDDLTVFITSEGEVFAYSGSNPNDPNGWSLKGSYQMSKPIGYNCVMPYQGDIVIISEDGYIPLSKALATANSGQSSIAFSDLIRGLVLDRTADNKNKKGWQGIIYNKKGYGIFNVPVSQGFEQHVINVNTGAWCRFTNIRSFVWCKFEDDLYFGSEDYIYKFDTGYSDDGLAIEGKVEQAYTGLGTESLKKIQLLNPRTRSSAEYQLNIYTNTDYSNINKNYFENVNITGQAEWDSAVWDEDEWATQSANLVFSQWIANSSTGYKISIVFKTKTRGNIIEWYETGVRYQVGSGII